MKTTPTATITDRVLLVPTAPTTRRRPVLSGAVLPKPATPRAAPARPSRWWGARARGQDRRLAAWLALTQFVLLSVYSIVWHEMWRDEAQAWLIARDNSLPELFDALRYEGHPALWHLLLWGPAHLGAPIQAMAVISAGVAAATTYVLIRFTPFPLVAKLCVPLCYLTVYENGVIARNYGIGILALLVVCAFATAHHPNWHLVGWSLFLSSQTNVMAVLLVPLLVLHLAVSAARSGPRSAARGRVCAITLPALLGLIVAWLQIRPPADAELYNPGGAHSLRAIWYYVFDSFVSIPENVDGFWESHAFAESEAVLALVTLTFSSGAVVLLRRTPRVALLYAGGLVALTAFFYLVNRGWLRHHEFYVVLLLIALWLALSEGGAEHRAARERSQRVLGAAVAVVLGLQAVGGLAALRADAGHTFSNARETARFLERSGYAKETLVFNGDYLAAAVLGYLDREAEIIGSTDRSYVRWDDDRSGFAGLDQIVLRLRDLVGRGELPVLVSGVALNSPELVEVGRFDGPAAAPSERFFVYLPEVGP